ncbi:MAG: hypothetical protein HWE25_14265 [Alphaproteobacteria bacterium]|nr:hypothetical protein [Alphaproteobacteria bacterium]
MIAHIFRIISVFLACVSGLALFPFRADAYTPSGQLEIHYINIGQGGSTLIIGPNGTRILYDFGNVGRGSAIASYLNDAVGLKPSEGIHYTIVSHRDQDHYGGFAQVIDAGYDIKVANYDSGSKKPASNRMNDVWLDKAAQTTAGAVTPISVGMRIPLGEGAEVRVIAANGKIFEYTEKLPFARNENDRSISLYIKYRNFDYILDGDIGAGAEKCTAHQTSQKDFQVPIAKALMRLGWMSPKTGVDVLHIAHHGSESSTSAKYYNLMKPEVGLVSVGKNQGTFRHPRVDVVEKILLTEGEERAGCVKAPPLKALFQTDGGLAGTSSTGATSFAGKIIGDIKLVTNGVSNYRISGSGHVEHQTFTENPEGGSWCFPLDEVANEVQGTCAITLTQGRD